MYLLTLIADLTLVDELADQTVLSVLADLTVLGVPARPPTHPQFVPDVAAALAHHQAWVGRAVLWVGRAVLWVGRAVLLVGRAEFIRDLPHPQCQPNQTYCTAVEALLILFAGLWAIPPSSLVEPFYR